MGNPHPTSHYSASSSAPICEEVGFNFSIKKEEQNRRLASLLVEDWKDQDESSWMIQMQLKKTILN